jgi:16S rRNA C967 or C1407 C5-methylase (RsmB/RsmF family)
VVPQPDWKTGRHPYHHAGAFYAQEPSASAPAALLDVHPGMRVADLCAAPGGKTSQLAAALAGQGVLLANEFVAARAEVLRQNLERMGVTNAIVTNEDTARLAAAYPGQFDRILVDAPCSGEGMFRKIPEARDEWSENNVKICAVRQAEILREAWKTLRPGGLLIYSTCTFNRLENEGSLEGLLAEAGEEIVESTAFDCPPAWGVVCGRVGPFRTRLPPSDTLRATAAKNPSPRVRCG